MKKGLKYFFILLGILFLLLLITPILFKGKIKEKLDQEITKNINASVYYPEISLSVFSNFPDITLQLDNFGIVGKDEFANDTLADVKSLQVTLGIWSVIGNSKISIKKILLEQPRIVAKVMKNGKANWDIMIPSEDTTTGETGSSSFSINLNKWMLEKGNIRYIDETLPVSLRIENLYHSGSGDFSGDYTSMNIEIETPAVTLDYDGVKYLNGNSLNVSAGLDLDLKNQKYVFRKNSVGINDLTLSLDGNLEMPGEDIKMDLKFGTGKTEFKSLLSLVPGVFTGEFDKIKTSGSFTLDGTAKGIFNSATNTLPAYTLNLAVENGFFQYPDLPQPVKNLTIKLNIENQDGLSENTSLSISQFHAELGNNPIDLKFSMKGLETMNLDGEIKGKINLSDIVKSLPISNLEMRGQLAMDASAKGIYNVKNKSMPSVMASVTLENGYFKSPQFPSVIDKTTFALDASSATGKPEDTYLDLKSFHAEIDNQPLDAVLQIKNIDDPAYNLNLNGKIDLEKIMKIFPQENLTLSGLMDISLKTAGRKSYVESGKYMQLPTSGSIKISNLEFKGDSFPQGLKISSATLAFSPQQLKLDPCKGFAGKSDFSVTGNLTNYLAFILLKNEKLKGTLSLTCNKFDVNEWLSEQAADPKTSEATTLPPADTSQAVEIPTTIDFEMNVGINTLLFQNLTLNDFKGGIIIRDKKLTLSKTSFTTLDGNVSMDGTFDTQNKVEPKMNFMLNLNQIDISKAYETFNTVRSMAPVARYSKGKVSTKFIIAGKMDAALSPQLNTFEGNGKINLSKLEVTNFPALNSIAEFTHINDFKSMQFKDMLLEVEIKEGRVHVKPFDVQSGNMKANIAGSNGIDKTMDYLMKLDVPSGAAGQLANAAFSALTGQKNLIGERVKINLNIGGTVDDPKVTGGSIENSSDTKNAVDDKVRKETERLKKEAEDKVRAEADRVKREAEARTKAEADRIKAEAEKKKREAEEKVRQEADRLKKEAEQKAKDALKGKVPLKFP
ncbi:MAG: hypothetical protein A3H98_14015 [Bacteroidetes bacterium RIFCSPLOWO2_02_FULL_36_8]|nr:MAG: hypothetical protein A3H98_14015 [Bacteroidetes bacterium RIFCSPLOWO2_02_FULL_36_8]OFY68783.1 MAG: hypothetical protein A3G23_03040 [Bacteroidetes bacterium RIFCSPLOWO2_12_FULL_37_12]